MALGCDAERVSNVDCLSVWILDSRARATSKWEYGQVRSSALDTDRCDDGRLSFCDQQKTCCQKTITTLLRGGFSRDIWCWAGVSFSDLFFSEHLSKPSIQSCQVGLHHHYFERSTTGISTCRDGLPCLLGFADCNCIGQLEDLQEWESGGLRGFAAFKGGSWEVRSISDTDSLLHKHAFDLQMVIGRMLMKEGNKISLQVTLQVACADAETRGTLQAKDPTWMWAKLGTHLSWTFQAQSWTLPMLIKLTSDNAYDHEPHINRMNKFLLPCNCYFVETWIVCQCMRPSLLGRWYALCDCFSRVSDMGTSKGRATARSMCTLWLHHAIFGSAGHLHAELPLFFASHFSFC